MADLKDFQLRATAQVLALVNAVGDKYFVKSAGVDALDSITAEDAVSEQGVNPGSTLLFQQLRCPRDGVGCVCQIIDQDGYPISDVADQHHGSILAISDLRGSSFLQNNQNLNLYETENIDEPCG